ncbi:MAG: BcpO-related WXXGXW repeat protein [Chlorobiaceae bacterium]|nr:BcpO-related WXXGXW repeat protein [Chlorobiaceae bacterium]
MRKSLCLAAAVAGMFIGTLSANAKDELSMTNRRSGVSIVISSRPNFIDLPDQGFSISVGSPYDIISYDNRYYLYQNGGWYNSSDYRGPWVTIEQNRLPDRIRRHRIEDIRRYRDVEYRKHDNRDNRYNMDQRRNDNPR